MMVISFTKSKAKKKNRREVIGEPAKLQVCFLIIHFLSQKLISAFIKLTQRLQHSSGGLGEKGNDSNGALKVFHSNTQMTLIKILLSPRFNGR